jgi:predicted DNA-binding protein (UPF0251 family)
MPRRIDEPPGLRALAADPTITQNDAAKQLGLTRGQVWYRLKRLGITWHVARRNMSRDEHIRQLHRQKIRQSEIGRMYGLSRQRVWQIIHGR